MACLLLYSLLLLLYCMYKTCCSTHRLLIAADIDVVNIVEMQDSQPFAAHSFGVWGMDGEKIRMLWSGFVEDEHSEHSLLLL